MNLPSIHSFVKELRLDYPKLTDFEALQLAVQMQRNEIMKRAFVISSSDDYPSALEKIAMHASDMAMNLRDINDFVEALVEVIKKK